MVFRPFCFLEVDAFLTLTSYLKLDADHKDGQEILQAYDNMFLVFNGNGTHLAPWYAKLGFQKPSAPGRIPFLPTMGSLTGNGGVIPLLDLAIEKVSSIWQKFLLLLMTFP